MKEIEKTLIGYEKSLHDNPSRRILMEADWIYLPQKRKKGKTKELHCFLFTDSLMLANRHKDTYKFRALIPFAGSSVLDRTAEGKTSFFLYPLLPSLSLLPILSVSSSLLSSFLRYITTNRVSVYLL